MSLKESAGRVQKYLNDNGFDLTVIELPGSTRTAREAADAIGCSADQIAKSLVFRDKNSNQPILVIASGGNRVDAKKLKAATGIKLGRVDGNWVKEKVGFAIGGVPPAGHSHPLKTFLDPDLRLFDTIWAAAGTPHALFGLSPDELERLTAGEWVDLAEEG